MRSCFLGQNVCALGFGVAMVQSRPLDPSQDPSAGELGRPDSPLEDPKPPENLMLKGLRRVLVPLS